MRRRAFLTLCSAAFFVPVSTLLAGGQKRTLQALVETLLPYSNENFSQCSQKYLFFIYTHPSLSDRKRNFLKRSLLWLEEFSLDRTQKSFAELPGSERQVLLEDLVGYRWGRDMIAQYTILLLEAAFGDPIYGVNPKEEGWKRIGFVPGIPRPTRIYDGR